MSLDNPGELLDHKQASKLLRLHPHVLHRWRAQGRVPAFRRGRRWFYQRADLLRLYEPVKAPAELPATDEELKGRADAALARIRAMGIKV